ncbi:HNH endonuclease [Janthinobacterium aestuarii]
MNPIQIDAAELLSLFQTVLWPAVITKNIDPKAEDRFHYDQQNNRYLNGNWSGTPVQVSAGSAFGIHFVEKKKLVYAGDYQGVEACEPANGRNKLIFTNVQCYEVVDWEDASDAQSALRAILKQDGAVTYSYYMRSSDDAGQGGPCFRMAEVKVRLQQSAFRKAVFAKNNFKCVVTHCSVDALLEAAHLPGKSWQDGDNGADDGIPLRADLHRALDANLIMLNTNHQLIYVDPCLQNEYGQYIVKAN